MKKIRFFIFISFCWSLTSCKKYLDKKPDIKLSIPITLSDFQQILNNNFLNAGSAPQVGDLGSDIYYLTTQAYQGLTNSISRNSYTWESDIFGTSSVTDWDSPYRSIYYSNVVLEGLEKYDATTLEEQTQKNDIQGQALFIRALNHYVLEEVFGQPYKQSSANSDLGIPLKLVSDPEDVAVRATVQAVFSQIVNDLSQARDLLGIIPSAINRPSKGSVIALLSRIYLTMHDYVKAGASANDCLQITGALKDFNPPIPPIQDSINRTSSNPFVLYARPNSLYEVLYPFTQLSYGVFNQTTTYVDSNLYKSYDNNDWRKTLFFRVVDATAGIYAFKGSYSGVTGNLFCGPAVDEVYLTRAECSARAGNKDAALADLNSLLIKRWKNTVPYPSVTAVDAEDALRKVLVERRKELILRGTRWPDLRRLNQDPRFAITITRNVNGQTYTLPPNDKRYAYPIPQKEIEVSGIPQNPR